jgi:radical SAM superfamily enzyme YgiQ (UPF0313 family)
VNEFDFIRKELRQVREVGIEDDTFTADKERVREICGLIISRRIKMRWYCNARVGLDLETLKLMRSAGCRLLAVGFESTSQEVLDGMHKGIAISQLRDFVGWVRKAKIAIHACFMAGNPGDTQKTLNEALGMAKKLNFDSAQFYPLFVYPGTEAFRWAQANKYLLTEKYDKWVDSSGGHNCVLNFPWLSNRQIMKFCKQATKEYYLRPRYLSSKIVQMLAHPQEIRRTFLSAGTFLKHLKNS